jgi:D-alanyl-D-alanine carboxypeptidase/D-alanyl-D-alanine-endopeptidase (penicillin-binding protein 4)
VLRVSGSVYRQANPVEAWVAVNDPVEYFGAALKQGFAQEGVEVRGRPVQLRELPVGVWHFGAVHRTDLLTTVEVINKRSQNFYAESVLKTLGAEVCSTGSWAAGLSVVQDFLAMVGIAPGSYEMADGSGMSRNNRFTPAQITRLLHYMFWRPTGTEFLRSLPYSGEEGLRWESRLADPPYRGNVFAKTGSLNSVSTLSGYAKGTSGRLYAFSILLNGSRSSWDAKRAQDRILQALVDQG